MTQPPSEMSVALREKIAKTIGYRLATQVSGNPMPRPSGDPRRRIRSDHRPYFDAARDDAAAEILALLRNHDH